MNTTLASLLAALLLWGSGLPQPAREEVAPLEFAPLVVVVHADNPMADLSSGELLSYFKMEKKWWPKPNRKRATLVLRGSRSDETRVLLESVYKMSASELRKYWVGKVFRGEITRKPSVVTKTKDLLARIAKDRGAFSIVRADEVTGKVRQLTIDGKRPGDEGYLLDPAEREVPAAADR